MRERWAITTPTDSRAQRNRAGRRGGQLLTRARSSSYGERPAHVTCSPVPLSRMVAPYAKIQAGTTGTSHIMPITNALESVQARLRKIIKTRGHFPTDAAATKLIWLALRNITAGWGKAANYWHLAMNQFAILYEDRFTRPLA